MAITSAICTSFKQEVLEGVHNFDLSTGDTFKMALYTSSATMGASTTAYSATNEATGTAYSAGGATLTNVSPTTSGTVAFLSFANPSWTTATFSTAGCLIYNSSKSNKAVACWDFGGTQSVVAGNFQVIMPSATASTALIRIA